MKRSEFIHRAILTSFDASLSDETVDNIVVAAVHLADTLEGYKKALAPWDDSPSPGVANTDLGVVTAAIRTERETCATVVAEAKLGPAPGPGWKDFYSGWDQACDKIEKWIRARGDEDHVLPNTVTPHWQNALLAVEAAARNCRAASNDYGTGPVLDAALARLDALRKGVPPSSAWDPAGEFRVEFQRVEGGPTLIVCGHAHDKQVTLNMNGVDNDETTWTRAMTVTLRDLNELMERVRVATKL